MNKMHAIALLACLALAAGCGRNDPSTSKAPRGTAAADPATGHALGKVAAKVHSKLLTSNITLTSTDARIKAEITPRGDLIIDGGTVAINDAQRALLLRYRAGIIDIAATGTDIGMQGADFGLRAAGRALRGALSGNGDQVGEEIEAEAREFEARARRICDHFPALLETQQQLAAQLPEFAPYAKMDQSDIDDCLDDTKSAAAAATS